MPWVSVTLGATLHKLINSDQTSSISLVSVTQAARHKGARGQAAKRKRGRTEPPSSMIVVFTSHGAVMESYIRYPKTKEGVHRSTVVQDRLLESK